MSNPINKIFQGHVLDVLKSGVIPEKYVNMIMCSPPYYSLRDYETEDVVWDSNGCEHDWNKADKKTKYGGGFPRKEVAKPFESESSFCSKCTAWKGSLGLEPSIDLYISHLVNIFSSAKKILRDDGTIWVVISDSYLGFNASHEFGKEHAKSLALIPQRFVLAMFNEGWIVRNEIIWKKPNCMPTSTKDRYTVDFEHLFFFPRKKILLQSAT